MMVLVRLSHAMTIQRYSAVSASW